VNRWFGVKNSIRFSGKSKFGFENQKKGSDMASNGNYSKSVNGNAKDRWAGITRPYSAEDVAKLAGSMHI